MFVSISSPLDASGSICLIFANELFVSISHCKGKCTYVGSFCVFFKVEENKNRKVVLGLIKCYIPSLHFFLIVSVTCS